MLYQNRAFLIASFLAVETGCFMAQERKHMKKLFQILCLMVVSLGFILPVHAQSSTGSLTIENPMEGYTYKVYQLLSGDVDSDAKSPILSNIEWGSSIKQDTLSAYASAADFGAALSKMTSAQLESEAYTLYSNSIDLASPVAVLNSSSSSVSNLQPGYYMVAEFDPNGTLASTSKFILAVLGDVSVYPKTGSPTIDKQVEHVSDGKSTWAYGTDLGYNDTATFRLSAALPENVEGYTSGYELTFSDTMSQGLSFVTGSATYNVVSQSGTILSSGNITPTITSISSSDSSNGGSLLTFALGNVLASPYLAQNYSTVYITYEAALNKNAVLGNEGNVNTLSVTYSNNINDPSSTATSIDKTASVYSFSLTVNKVNENLNALSGADFQLQKQQEDDKGNTSWKTIDEITDASQSTFVFNGLSAGKYCLKETTTPDGYNSIDPIYFVIDDPASSTGQISIDAVQTHQSWETLTPATAVFTSLSSGNLSTTIKNQKGLTLPKTGDIGSTIFFGIGALLIAGGILAFIGFIKGRKASV
jgi:fimbrial isopeptide formation D2 family protein/LPXTG-motif cell wall-anchored protein